MPRHSILVTGSRGKSTVVRMLHAAMDRAGFEVFARITGVMPRELGPAGTRMISRSANAHVEEMRWWLRRMPATTQAVVMENSAITPDLQKLAGQWMNPDITVLTNTLPDHQEVWGPGSADAAQALVKGIPGNGQVILPDTLKRDQYLLDLLEQRQTRNIFCPPATGVEPAHRAANLGLALGTIQQLGLDAEQAMQAMLDLQPDICDFRVVRHAGSELAMAFSANDISSSQALFRSLQWPEEETHLLYNHRADRPARLDSFLGWLNRGHWREVLIVGDRPLMRTGSACYRKIRDRDGLLKLLGQDKRVFGCGNIAGLPMTLVTA